MHIHELRLLATEPFARGEEYGRALADAPNDALECSTLVWLAATGPSGVQTWDWHAELVPGAAGNLALFFNILSHESDARGRGVPVHAVARRILEEADTVEQALARAERGEARGRAARPHEPLPRPGARRRRRGLHAVNDGCSTRPPAFRRPGRRLPAPRRPLGNPDHDRHGAGSRRAALADGDACGGDGGHVAGVRWVDRLSKKRTPPQTASAANSLRARRPAHRRVAGLHLGLHLLQQGKEVTIFTNRTSQDVFDGRIMNSVSHMHVTQAIENQLGIGDWPDVDGYYYRHYHYNGWGEDREFYGDFTMPSRVIDYRIYLPRLMREFEKRGGELIIRELDRPDIEALTEQYDLVVVSTGKGEIGAMFPKREDKSPYGKPQRHLTLSLWRGVRELDPAGVAVNIVPGVGELLVIPIWSHAGRVSALLSESVPGGPQDVLNSKKQHEDPEGFRERILDVLETHYPPVFDRVDHDKFELTSDKDVLQGAFAPSLREDYIQLPNGKFLLALGDVHLTVDPVTAQGGNAAANSAKDTAAVFAEDDVYDEHFLRKVARRRAERVEGVNDWVNMMIATPGHERIGQFFTAMAHDKALADEFTENFNYPTRQLDLLSSQERVNARTAAILQAASQPA